MAKPRATAKPDPPAEESEEEEVEGSTEEESEAEPEAENQTYQGKAPSTPAPDTKKPEPGAAKTPQAAVDSSSEEGSDDDEDSGSDTDSGTETPNGKPDARIKPIASKPMDDPLKKTGAATRKPRSKPTSPTRSIAGGTGAKRAAAVGGGDEQKDAKRSKKEAESSDRKLFGRVWTEDDEIALLKGMLKYWAKEKADPLDDLNAFLEFIRKDIHFDVSKSQLQDKIRRLKKKYENKVAEKERKGKKEITFSSLHDKTAYEFSKKLWGKEKDIGGEEENFETPKATETTAAAARKDLVTANWTTAAAGKGLVTEEWVLENWTDLITDAKKRAELDEKWKELKVIEIKALAMRSNFVAEISNLVLESLNSSS